MFSSKRKGFTLVELLIVIVVIGVLSTMMMLSSTEAVSSAKAATIISNMRNLKTAALAFRTDHLDAFCKEGNDTKLDASKIPNSGIGTKEYFGALVNKNPQLIKKYLGENTNFSLNGESTNTNHYCSEGGYAVRCADHGNEWYVAYRFANNETALKAKIKCRAASIGLLGSDKHGDLKNSSLNGNNDIDALTTEYNNHKCVLLRIF